MTRTTRHCHSVIVLTLCLVHMNGNAQSTIRLSLRDAAQMAGANNPVVLAAHKDVEAAQKQLSRSWREYAPTVTTSARYSYLDDDISLKVKPITVPLPPAGVTITVPPVHLLDRSTWRADISATMPLFTGLRIESGIRASRHVVAEAEAQDTLTLQKQIVDALIAYHQVLLARENCAAREEAFATVNRHELNVSVLRREGTATEYDVIRARLAVAEATRSLDEAKLQYRLAQQSLNRALALDESVTLALNDSLTFHQRSIGDDQALEEASHHRPELVALDEKRETVRAMACVETGKMLPQIGAFARYELVDRSLTQLDPKWVVGVSASLTLFNGLKDLASAQMYEIQEEKIEDLRRDVEKAIALEVRRYHSDLQTAEKQIATTRTALDLADEALRMANRRFESGMGTSLEVIDAQTSVVAMRTSHAAALYAYRIAYIQLVRSLGRTEELLTGVF
jgi:outer membrane protein